MAAATLEAAPEAPATPDLVKTGGITASDRGRIASIDTVRGFALLGIFLPNLYTFQGPTDQSGIHAIFTPTMWNDVGQLFIATFVETKFMAMFAMLFGAGAVLTLERGMRTSVWCMRCVWLIAFGMAHALFIWFGDILFMYGVSGLAIMSWARKLSARTLLAIGVPVWLVGLALMAGVMALGSFQQTPDFFEAMAQGPGVFMGLLMQPNPALAEAYNTAPYGVQFMSRTLMVLIFWIFFQPLGLFWSGGLMLIGAGLAKLGFITGRSKTSTYRNVLILGLLVGLPMSVVAVVWTRGVPGDGNAMRTLGAPELALHNSLLQFFGILLSLAYISAFNLLCRANVAGWLTGALAVVGRMAFSNYILCSVLAAVFFYGWGLGNFGRYEFPELWLVVIGVWGTCVLFSLAWLSAFRMGPLEWLWRTASRLRIQPLQRAPRSA
ncbi:MAG: DUF418 domain-containing protein [Planctomycetota bacterium]